jgi:hypothetical protein
MGTFLSRLRFRKLLTVLSLLVITLGMLWVKVFMGSMKAYEEGERSLEQSEFTRAVTYYDRSLHWYAPWNPYVERSAQRLWEISEKAEGGGDVRLAIIALRTIRRGFYGASHLYLPGKPWIERCELKIQELLDLEIVRHDSSHGEGRVGDGSKKVEDISSPDVFWSLVVEVGFLGWIGSALCFIVSAFPDGRSGRKRLGRSLTWSILLVISFSLWIIGMIKA